MLWHPGKIIFLCGPGNFGKITEDGERLKVEWRAENGELTQIDLTPRALEIQFPQDNMALCFSADQSVMEKHGTILRFEKGTLHFSHREQDVSLLATSGSIEPNGKNFQLKAAGKQLRLAILG